ncbi:Ion transport protein-domain-containing protein [Cristinia sonorae]|uniref:Calcium-channel protein CCH1 n=1 Tax=Cristinia sonorae TaxID=1940300 RepID=A0A8K0XTB1_9AGAR|nr:Ion transport protein-domain-containing protein [Cristinia sonorae]
MDGHHHSLSGESSSSSAIDIPGTPSRLGSAGPSSPALTPEEGGGSFARRRTSWGRVEASDDPLRLDLSISTLDADPLTSTPRPGKSGWLVNEDPFVSSPVEEDAPVDYTFRSAAIRAGTYTTAQPGPSSASLIPSDDVFVSDSHREDDEAHLTGNMSRMGTTGDWGQDDMNDDPERSAPTTRSKRKNVRYSTSPRSLKKTGTRIMTMSRNIRRASLRVVNLAGMGLEDHVRLGEGVDRDDDVEQTEEEDHEEAMMDLASHLPLRGRTLACMGPSSKLRLAMFQLLVYPWTEPVILLLIILNAVVLTIQAARSQALPLPDGTDSPPQIRGYFHSWEDYTLFVLFILFTLECFARIAVSGFILDPEVPTSSLLSAFSTTPSEAPVPSSAAVDPISLSRHPSSLGHSSQRRPGQDDLTFGDRLRQLRVNIMRPFALSGQSQLPQRDNSSSKTTRRRSDTVQSQTPMMEKMSHLHSHIRHPSQPTFFSTAFKSDNEDFLSLPFRLSIQRSQNVTKRNLPYLRQSWLRIDFVAVMSFWVAFTLAMAGVERGTYHIGIFRALSVLRTARLLAITSGTTTIMRSLKTARPLLASVAYFVLFAMILFSIIGIQSFKGSFRRSCQLLPTLGEDSISLGNACGAYIDPETLEVQGYLTRAGGHGPVKGFICPLGQICKEDDQNPNSDLASFDTIYFAALQVFIVSSANGWSPLMYQMMDSEYFVSCFFFIVCIIVLNFWLINLFVAVITNTFSAIRKDTSKSAFGAAPLAAPQLDNDDGWAVVDGKRIQRNNRVKEIYENVRWCWVALALTSLVLQATRQVDISPMHQEVLDKGELVLTIVFDVEIFIRIVAHLPDWRSFFYRGQNWLDLTLAIGSTVIQIPAIHDSSVYPWLTIFQLGRFYRVILEIPRMKPLLLAVFGNMYGLANMSLFLIMINFLTALVAVQLLRGDIERGNFIDFGEIFNSFLAIYQVFSSENWTDVLYGAAEPEVPLRQSAIVLLFIAGWMFFANYIVLQMFIAVINENFDVAEESKRSRQAKHYWASHRPEQARAPWVRRLNPYRWFPAKPKAVAVEQLPSNLVLPMQKTLIQDYDMPKKETKQFKEAKKTAAGHYSTKSLQMLQSLFTGESARMKDVPLTTIRNNNKRDSMNPEDHIDEETERHLDVLAALNSETTAAEETDDVLYERRAQKADFIREHPTFDKTFWLFSQKNPVRRFCQILVAPANGERIHGVPPHPIAHLILQVLLLLTVVGGITVEIIATPIYRRNFYTEHGFIRGTWFDHAELAFGIALLLEFIIKVFADGFLFTPNAYVRSIWNILDLLILIGVVVNVTSALIVIGGASRITRSLKALRVLRLITLIEKMRSTFESLIISGAARIMDAALLAILYMIPYAVWGLNIFAGLMNQCNDTNVSGLTTCVGEYPNSIIGDSGSFDFLVPRVWDNPAPSTTFSFDSFRSSLLILFEIVSLEGWIDVMGVAVSITGAGTQPETNVAQANAIFFLIYNLLGGVVILTLFVSIIIGNFTAKTGTALLTQPQREWIDLQKLIKRQKPSKRPKRRPVFALRAWCYDRAMHKHGWWHRLMTWLFVVHVVALMTQTFSTEAAFDEVRNDFFILVTAVYVVDIIVRLYGLGWNSYSANGWNIFDVFVAGGSLVTTVVVRAHGGGFAVQQLQKLFLTTMAFKLVQRTNSLNKLFKTSVASLPVIVSLLSLWLILFMFFGILFVEVFSMTKWNTGENRHQNYSTMSNALVMLAFMTTGEGWNQYMHDFAIEYPRCTNSSPETPYSDCGSASWSFTLFIAWNLLSMYIFTNLFTGVVVESFYYVFQMTGGAKSITREEIRSFKKVWAELANPRTGYLERANFVRFFGRLTGIFEVRIYPVEYSIPRLVARSQASEEDKQLWPSRVVRGVNVDVLNADLANIDPSIIKKRKELYNRLFHEARISFEPGKGISFTNMLLLLAHHKLIVDTDALVLKDLVVRTETTKLVKDLVDFDRVQSLLLMISHRRRYLAMREQMGIQAMQQQGVPAIIVEGSPSTPPPSTITRDITSPGQSIYRISDPDSPTPRSAILPSPEVTFSLESPGANLHRSRRFSEASMLSTDIALRSSFESTRDSRYYGDEDAQNVMASMQNSMWRDMMLEAEEEDA